MTSSLWSLLWWVAIGLVFFWMMSRGGCGMMGHGGHRSERANGREGHRAPGKPVDPVCGMEVDPAQAAGTRVADGTTFFFCSQTCLDAFDRNPSMYAHRPEQHGTHRQHAAC